MGGDHETRMFELLGRYRITPQTITGESLAQMLMSKTPRFRLDLLLPGRENWVLQRQETAQESHNSAVPEHMFYVGDTVWAMNFAATAPKWLPGDFVALPWPSKLYSWPNRWTCVEATHWTHSGTAARGECHDDITQTARGCCSTCESCTTFERCPTCESYSICERRYRRSGDGEITTRSVIEWLCNRRWRTEFNANSSCCSGTSQIDTICSTDHYIRSVIIDKGIIRYNGL